VVHNYLSPYYKQTTSRIEPSKYVDVGVVLYKDSQLLDTCIILVKNKRKGKGNTSCSYHPLA